MSLEICLECSKEFEFIYDPGWNEIPICWPCRKAIMKDYFNDPETKRMVREALSAPPPQWVKDLKEAQEKWAGAYIPIPYKID